MAQPILFPLERLADASTLGAPPFMRPLLPAADFVTEYAFTLQSRQVANYRGSFSAVSGAADEAFPQTDAYASPAVSRAVAFFKSPLASISQVFDNSAATPDTFAALAASVPVPFYNAPSAQTIQAFTANLDAWAQTTFGRATPYYAGSRAITIAVYDPATNSFADWTPAALLSRSVNAYSAPKAQPQVAWGQSIVTDVPVAGAFSRVVAYYRAPVAFISRAYDQPAASGSDYASSTLSRRVANYVGSYSAVWNAADAPAPADTWASIFASRAAQRYAAPRALVVSVYDPATNTFADWTPSALLSRRVAGYAAPLSRSVPVYDQPAVAFGTDWASVAQGYRAAFRYQGPQSRTIAVYDPATNSFADWTPSALTSRIVPLFRSPAAFLARAYAQSVFGTDYATVTQSRRVAPPVRRPESLTVATWFSPALVFGTEFAPRVARSPRVYPDARRVAIIRIGWPDVPPPPLVVKGYSRTSDTLAFYILSDDGLLDGVFGTDSLADGSSTLDALADGSSTLDKAQDGIDTEDA